VSLLYELYHRNLTAVLNMPPQEHRQVQQQTSAYWWARAHPYTILGVIVLIGLAFPFLLRQHSEWENVYLQAASNLLAGKDIYAVGSGYLYPPFGAWLAIPFTFLPQPVSRMVWFLINMTCLFFMCRWAWLLSGGKSLEGATARDKKEHFIFFLGLASGIRYAFNALSHQQTDVVIGALLMGGCLVLQRKGSLRAGTCFGLAAAFKATPLLWSPYLLWRGWWGAALGLVCVALGANLLPNLVSAPGHGGLWLTEWVSRYLLPMSASNHYPGIWGSAAIFNQSLAGAGYRWFVIDWRWTETGLEVIEKSNALSPTTLKWLVYGSEALLLLGASLLLRRHGSDKSEAQEWIAPVRDSLEYSVILLLMLLLSPMSGKAHFGTMILPGFCLARLAVRTKDATLWALLLISILTGILSNEFLWGERVSSLALWYGSVTWSAFFLMLGCGYGLAKRSKDDVRV